MNKRTWILVVVLAVLAALSAPARAGGTERYERTIEQEVALPAGEALLVENLLGSLTVRAAETRGRVLLEARVVTDAESRAAGNSVGETISLVESSEDGVRVVRVRFPVDEHPAFRTPRSEKDGLLARWVTPLVKKSTVAAEYDGKTVEVGDVKGALPLVVHLKVTVPLDVRASFRQIAGTLHVVGVRGTFALEAVQGQIVAEQVYGSLDARTGGGEIVVRKFSGDSVAVRTASGDVDVTNLQARRATVATGSGRIDGDGISAEALEVDSGVGEVILAQVDSVSLHVESDAGDVDVAARLTRTRDGSIRAAAGDVTLRVNPTTPFDLRAETDSGQVKYRDLDVEVLEEEKNVLRLVRGSGGGAALEVRSGKGAVTIRSS